MDPHTPLKTLSAFRTSASKLEKLGVYSLQELVFYLPFRYEDYSLVSTIAHLLRGDTVTVKAKVVSIKNIYTKTYKKIQQAIVRDETGELTVLWFNQPYLVNVIPKNAEISLSGKVDFSHNRKLSMVSPDYEILFGDRKTIHTGRLVPIYPETKGISSKWIRRQTYSAVTQFGSLFTEYLPFELRTKENLLPLPKAVEQIHFPQNTQMAEKARERLAFEELFFLQLNALQRRTTWKKKRVSRLFSVEAFRNQTDTFIRKLPFVLTSSQKQAIGDIFHDLSQERPMNRLIEGDVGSGKTVVAAVAMYLSLLNGFCSILMAPTEILAAQHFKTISELFAPFNVHVSLVTGAKKILNNDQNPIFVGTHALLSEKVPIENVGLVVIDEQQRFGVAQRSIVRKKGGNPHLLTMTATPIPRTVALTMYGDLDVSYLNDMPKGRKAIKTWLVPSQKRENGYEWIKKQIRQAHSQAYIICPFIEESESFITVKAAKKEFEHLQRNVFSDFRLGLLHGKLKAKEKENVLKEFTDGNIDILVATPVVEVGIDVKNATIILIEGSERFGLSQLHQLRGRVGRGSKQSYCLLFTEQTSEEIKARLKAMETLHNGRELSEFDLTIRGAGDLFGTKQHGMHTLKIARFSDTQLLERAKKQASLLFPVLSSYPILLEKLSNMQLQEVSLD